MSLLLSMTRKQWTILLVLLGLNVLCLYGGAIPLALAALNPESPPATSVQEELALAPETATPPEPSRTATASPTRTRTPTPSATSTPTSTRTATAAPTPTVKPTPVAPTPVPPAPVAPVAPALVAARSLASMELNPRANVATQTTFFTSACYGQDANLLQDRDYMAPADWSSSPDRKCIFGFRVNPADSLPAGRYSVFGGSDGQPRFYIIPPEAFAQDQTRVKQLSELHLIVDTDQGCEALGSLGVTADGQSFQCSACAFLKAGGFCPTRDGTKSIVLPVNRNNILDANDTGGAMGFQSFPLVLFRKGFSVYFTGRAGYAPPRTYFESAVDTLTSGVNIKTTAEMTDREIKEIAAQFDGALTGIDPIRQLAPLEQEATLISPPRLALKPKEKGSLSFTTTPGAVLSSIVWSIRPITNQGNQKFLETNLCLDLNGEQVCFTGVEDFAHCAFYVPCRTGYSSLVPSSGPGYVATRYFPAGAAPLINDGRIAAKFQAPDIGSVIEIEVKIRVRNVANR